MARREGNVLAPETTLGHLSERYLESVQTWFSSAE